jgi:hypothetical protein
MAAINLSEPPSAARTRYPAALATIHAQALEHADAGRGNVRHTAPMSGSAPFAMGAPRAGPTRQHAFQVCHDALPPNVNPGGA